MAEDKKENKNLNRVIVNSDDYGLNEHNSDAIAEAFAKGLITDTTMLANFDFFDQAVRLAEEQGFSDKIGVHLNLTEGVPLTEEIRRCPRFVTDGVFNKVYNKNRTLPLNAAEKDAIYRELTAQVERIEAAGIRITHADSHHHIHTGVFVAPIAVRVCREHGIDKMRLHRNLGDIPACKRFVKNRYNRWLKEPGFVTTRYFAYVMDLGEDAIPDDTEIMVHADYDKNGVLIDRRGMEDGYPIGYPLPDFRNKAKLRGFTEL